MSRKIRIATVSMARQFRDIRTPKDNFKYLDETLAEIAHIDPDITVLPEIFPVAGIKWENRDTIPDQGKDQLRKWAQQHNTSMVGSLYEERNGSLYNTSLMMKRDGEIAGRYDKIHPNEPEIRQGITPGSLKQKPVETEFGKVGMQICFDANWKDDWVNLAEQGAELVLFSSAYPGGQILNSIALLNQIFIVPSIIPLYSGIINNTGEWIVRTDRFSWWVWSDINLDRTVFHRDFQIEKISGIREKYGGRIKVETFGEEALFTLEPMDEDVCIDHVIREFELVTYRNYLSRAAEAQEKGRRGC